MRAAYVAHRGGIPVAHGDHGRFVVLVEFEDDLAGEQNVPQVKTGEGARWCGARAQQPRPQPQEWNETHILASVIAP